MEDSDQGDSAFAFEGSWREFAPIAFTNLLLTIVTLGFYRFWATTRERRYLWSRTRFIDDRLEWTGTGLELFIGFILVVLLFGIPFLILQFGLQALVLRGEVVLVVLITLSIYLFLLYMFGLARFRALRYRLSRTYWHGIRGGSDDQGFRYGLSSIWRPVVGFLAFGLMIPWSMTTLWNKRWNKMSFGPFDFESGAQWPNIMGRYLLCVGFPFIAMLAGLIALAPMAPAGYDQQATVISGVIIFLIVYVGFALVMTAFYAAFFREAVDSLSLSDLSFGFTARTMDWLKLILGHIGLVIVTLGIGLIFIRYRNWRFFITHMHAYGEIDTAALTQSATREPGQGEGLLDAFDVGAI